MARLRLGLQDCNRPAKTISPPLRGFLAQQILFASRFSTAFRPQAVQPARPPPAGSQQGREGPLRRAQCPRRAGELPQGRGDGLYRADHHLAIEQGRATPGRDSQDVVAAHVRRLEALRRTGIVERVADGLWKVPDDLAERGRQYDAQRLGGVAVELKSHLPIERQVRVIGVTWLDQQLIGGGRGLGDMGFGGEAKQAMQQRTDFLAEQGLAERRGQRVAGIYRRSVMLASGRYAMLDDGMGFSLVPWRPVIEQRLGQQIAATVRGGGVSWEIGRGQRHVIS